MLKWFCLDIYGKTPVKIIFSTEKLGAFLNLVQCIWDSRPTQTSNDDHRLPLDHFMERWNLRPIHLFVWVKCSKIRSFNRVRKLAQFDLSNKSFLEESECFTQGFVFPYPLSKRMDKMMKKCQHFYLIRRMKQFGRV